MGPNDWERGMGARKKKEVVRVDAPRRDAGWEEKGGE